jgi:hypothetical protein
MMRPVKLANEMSALSGKVRSNMTRCGHEATERSRSGAGDESTGRNVAGDGQADHLVPGGGVPRHQLSVNAALEDTPAIQKGSIPYDTHCNSNNSHLTEGTSF